MHSKISRFIIVCVYCERCYGEYANQEKKYFPPKKIISTDPISHGICPECNEKIEDLID